jgi:hypothetical protein
LTLVSSIGAIGLERCAWLSANARNPMTLGVPCIFGGHQRSVGPRAGFVLAAPVFAREVVGRAVLTGHGEQLLDLLRELGAGQSAGPLLLALDAALRDATAKLRAAPPEMRAAALHLYGLILEAELETATAGP